MESKEWVKEKQSQLTSLTRGTLFDVNYRNGHAKSQYYKFKDKRFKHQIRISDHKSIRWKTKFQILKCVSGSGYYKDDNVWIITDNAVASMLMQISETYLHYNEITKKEHDLFMKQLTENIDKYIKENNGK